jgi:hypothetical protein
VTIKVSCRAAGRSFSQRKPSKTSLLRFSPALADRLPT